MTWAVGGLLALGLAAGPEELVVLPDFDADIPVPVRASLTEAAGATVQGFERQARVVESSCAGDQCTEVLAGARGIALRVTRQARDYTVVARLLAPDGSVQHEARRECRICRHAELGTTVREAVEAAAEPLRVQTGTLAVVSTPVGATVTLDGERLGATPLQVELPAGSYEVSVRAQGYRPAKQVAEVVADDVARHAFELSRGLGAHTEIQLGWGVLGVGAAALATGLVLVAIDGSGRDTLGAGLGMTIGGVVFGAAGTAALLHGRSRRGGTRSLTLGPGGFQGRF